MTTKRLLEDVNVLKKDRENDGHSKKRSRRTSAGEADANEDDIDPKRQSSCSTRLSYSSGSSSSSESGQQSSIETSSQTSLLCDIDRESLFSPKNSTERSNAIRKNEKKPLGVIFDAGKGIGESPLVRRGTYGAETWPTYWGDETNQNFQRMKNIQDNRNEEGEVEDVDEDGRRFSTLEKDQSPINTSYETTFTRADTGESSHFTNTSGGLMSTASDVNFGRKKADEKGIREGRDADMHPL